MSAGEGARLKLGEGASEESEAQGTGEQFWEAPAHGHSPMASFLPSPAAPEHLGTGGAHCSAWRVASTVCAGSLLRARGEGPPAEPRPAPLPRPDSSPHPARTHRPLPPCPQALRPAPGPAPDSSPRPGPAPPPAGPRNLGPAPPPDSWLCLPAPPPPHLRKLLPAPHPPLRLLSPPLPLLVQRGPLALVTGETREDISVVAGRVEDEGAQEPHVCGPGRRVGQSTGRQDPHCCPWAPLPPGSHLVPESGNPLLITARVSAPNKICGLPHHLQT